jgi:hypothetical protein
MCIDYGDLALLHRRHECALRGNGRREQVEDILHEEQGTEVRKGEPRGFQLLLDLGMPAPTPHRRAQHRAESRDLDDMHLPGTLGRLNKVPLQGHLVRVERREQERPRDTCQRCVEAARVLQVTEHRLNARSGDSRCLLRAADKGTHRDAMCHKLLDEFTPNGTGGSDNQDHSPSYGFALRNARACASSGRPSPWPAISTSRVKWRFAWTSQALLHHPTPFAEAFARTTLELHPTLFCVACPDRTVPCCEPLQRVAAARGIAASRGVWLG